jgi:hypothetical protein
MAIKWTEKDVIECMQTLRNPFEKTGMAQAKTNAKPNLADVIGSIRQSGGSVVPEQENGTNGR